MLEVWPSAAARQKQQKAFTKQKRHSNKQKITGFVGLFRRRPASLPCVFETQSSGPCRITQLELVWVEVGPEKIGGRPWRSDVPLAPHLGGHDTYSVSGASTFGCVHKQNTKQNNSKKSKFEETGGGQFVACAGWLAVRLIGLPVGKNS